MKFSTTSLVLATLAAQSVSAGTLRHGHKHAHEKKDAYQWTPPPGYDWRTDTHTWGVPAATQPAVEEPTKSAAPAKKPGKKHHAQQQHQQQQEEEEESSDDDNTPSSGSSSGYVSKVLQTGAFGILAGSDNRANNGFVWQGESGGAFSNKVINRGETDYVLYVYKTELSPADIAAGKDPLVLGDNQWLQHHAAVISVDLPAKSSTNLQYAKGAVGGFVALSKDTSFSEIGLAQATLGEFNTGDYATFDVSREWYSEGKGMTIHGKSGCITSTDGNVCAFVCKGGALQCGEAGTYDLLNTDHPECNLGYEERANSKGQMVKVPEGGCRVDSKIKTEIW